MMDAVFDGVIDGQSSKKRWAITDVDPQETSATLYSISLNLYKRALIKFNMALTIKSSFACIFRFILIKTLLYPILQCATMASHALYMLLVQPRMPWFSLSYTSSLFIAQTRSYIFQVREVFHNGVLWLDIILHDLPAPQA